MNQLDNSLDKMPVWDKPAALNRLMNKETLLARLVKVYLDGDSQRMAEFEKAVQGGSPVEIKNVAHSIKGIAANLSLNRLQHFSGELEQAAKDEKLESAAGLSAQIVTENNTVVQLFSDFLHELT